MKNHLAIGLGILALGLAACGGGSGGGYQAPRVQPTPVPTATATVVAQGNLPLPESVAGSRAWVEPSSHKTLYVLDVDTTTTQLCTGGCLSAWPAFNPSTNATAAGNLSVATRSDGTGSRWAYQLHPLYTFAGDTGADRSHGDGLPDFGGHRHIARPAAETPPVGSPPCQGAYC